MIQYFNAADMVDRKGYLTSSFTSRAIHVAAKTMLDGLVTIKASHEQAKSDLVGVGYKPDLKYFQ